MIGFLRLISSVNTLFRGFISSNKLSLNYVGQEELIQKCSTPFKELPNLVEREEKYNAALGLNIILGGTGVGKTRQGFEFVKELSDRFKVERIYHHSGYISRYYELSLSSEVKKVIVFLDDYGHQNINIGSISINDKPNHFEDIISNINYLFRNFSQSVELVAMIVTINTDKILISADEVKKSISGANVCELQPISQAEYKGFIDNVLQQFEIKIEDKLLKRIIRQCDGRLSTISVFLSSHQNSIVGKEEIEKYIRYQSDIWNLFKSNLNPSQLLIYNAIKLLIEYDLAIRFPYLFEILKGQQPYLSRKHAKRIANSIWKTADSEIIVYKNQFNIDDKDRSNEKLSLILNVLIKAGKELNRSQRYDFQLEVKNLLVKFYDKSISWNFYGLINKMRKWYPQDKFIAFFKALILKDSKKYIKAVYLVYKALKRRDVLDIMSGKWVEIKLHLLLAELYALVDPPGNRHWHSHVYIEREYIASEEITDIDIHDFEVGDFKLVHGKDNEGMSLSEYLNERGYGRLEHGDYEIKKLKKIVHLNYAVYLEKAGNREIDLLNHIDILLTLYPNNANNYILGAKTCLEIYDPERAIYYMGNMQKNVEHNQIDNITEFLVNDIYFRAYADLGIENEAKDFLKKCIEIKKDKLKEETEDIINYLNNEKAWEYIRHLTNSRKKHYSNDTLTYKITGENLTVNFPTKWVMKKEVISEDNVVIAAFSSPILWKKKIKTPFNASIELIHGNKKSKLNNLIEPKIAKWSFTKVREGKNVSHAITYDRWNFRIDIEWPKIGYQILFYFDNYLVLVRFTTEKVSEQEMMPIFNKIEEEIIAQLR